MSTNNRVCVTGASGYIASNLIEQLIQKGFQVNGTVRSLSNEERIEHLKSQFSGDLDLFEADLLIPSSFDDAVKGCSAVFHTASPFQLQVADPVKDLVEPALQGTLNVLESVKKANIKRVILTSSVAAIVGDTKISDDYVYSEADWNLDSTPKDGVSGYRYSKRVAEEAAWAFAKENEIALTTINPSFVLGPALSKRTDSTSIKTVIGLVGGFFKSGAAPSCYGCVDVRDVALAHIQALERPKSIGSRYMVTSKNCYNQIDLSNILREILTENLSEYSSLIANLPSTFSSPPKWKTTFDNSKVREELGVELKSIRDSLHDMLQFMFSSGLLKIPKQTQNLKDL